MKLSALALITTLTVVLATPIDLANFDIAKIECRKPIGCTIPKEGNDKFFDTCVEHCGKQGSGMDVSYVKQCEKGGKAQKCCCKEKEKK